MNSWASVIGPCYLTASIARELAVTPSTVSRAARELRLLRLPTPERICLFPVFQLMDGAPVAGLQAVLRILQVAIDDPWTWAQWLNTPHSNRASNIDALKAGERDDVLLRARHDAWVWRS
jgi:hypothetical protein